MDQGRAFGAPGRAAGGASAVLTRPPFSTLPDHATHSATSGVLAADRLVSPVPLPPDCPASPARVKGGLRPSQAIEQTALDP